MARLLWCCLGYNDYDQFYDELNRYSVDQAGASRTLSAACCKVLVVVFLSALTEKEASIDMYTWLQVIEETWVVWFGG